MKQLNLTLFITLFITGMIFAQTGNEADIGQDGENHQAHITQSGEGNDAALQQQGSNHSGFIKQIGSNNQGVVHAFDNDNRSVIIQVGDDHNIQFSMEGEFNVADIRQFGTSDHSIGFAEDAGSIFQDGNHNEFYAVQIGNGVGHSITTLDGSDKIQQGDGNYIDAWQKGSGHQAKLQQTGDDNMISVFQKGTEHMSTVRQSGNNNLADIHQY